MTWRILPDPLTPDVPVPSGLYTETPETGRGKSLGLFGRGLMWPLRRADLDFNAGTGADLVRAAVALVLMTVCNSDNTYGELPWRTEFGSLLQVLRMRNNDAALAGLARFYVVGALTRWIPSVRVRSTRFSRTDANTFVLHVVYDVVDPVGTQVLVPGLQTALPLG